MLIDYPRTKVLVLDGMAHYQRKLRQEGSSRVQAAQEATNDLARDIISAFEEVIATPAVLSPELRPAMYEWVRHFAGGSFATLLTESSLQQILQSKIARGLL
jgi:hypothetical protein